MVGVSGAFLLLPFQMSVLGFVSPAVSPTNMIYNVVAIPSGVYRYVREGRMVWPLTWLIVCGTLPGVVIGGHVRLNYLYDARPFAAFAGCVLLYIGGRLVADLLPSRGAAPAPRPDPGPDDPASSRAWVVEHPSFDWRALSFRFRGREYRCSVPGVFALSLVVGVVGGVYGIGGGAIIAPVLVAFYRLPMHTVAGATLMSTFTTCVAGLLYYQLAAASYADTGLVVAPDWLLGAMFGLGGLAGMYAGARTQRFVSSFWLKLMLSIVLLGVALRYLGDFIQG
jgi:uncharacterized membrane protein YfcA